MKLTKYIPDTITSMNLLCGVVGVIFAFKGRLDTAFLLMLAGSVFDYCDGLAARALGAYSDLGKELDSLSDLVTFGVLPSMMLFNLMAASRVSCDFWCFIPLLIAVFSGLRLAKFNTDPRQSLSFIGLATPACALLCGAMCYLITKDSGCFLGQWSSGDIFIPVLSVVLSVLLVCEIPMFSMKIAKGHKSDGRTKTARCICAGIIVISAITAAIAGWNWSAVVIAAIAGYIAVNIIFHLFVKA